MEKKRVKMWDNYEVLGEVPINAKSKLEIAACTRNGFRYVAVHEYIFVNRREAWIPSKKRIAIPLRTSADGGKTWLTPFATALPLITTCGEKAAEMELVDEAKEVWFEVTK